MDHIYLRSQKDERGIRRIGAIGIKTYRRAVDNEGNMIKRFVIKGSFCSPKDNFSKETAREYLYSTLGIDITPEILEKVTFKSVMKRFKFEAPAIKQGLDWERAEASFNKLKARAIESD